MGISEMALEIISKTNDGSKLSPIDLKLVEMGVNGYLSEEGEAAFYKLHDNVISGYKIPFLHGIEHLTLDQEGFVYWKGHHVEHYSSPWVYSNEGKKEAEELARRCMILEKRKENISPATTVWNWRD